ncbi:MAG TPA: hypothetical protein H9870_09885 [Candidatus Corynebacterium avicola]|uniref:Cobalamin biosynthesis protein CbiX n=1 Tax=Candidatus Corynebacterium avicola TaxID=2838527 RepID=A0A9D1RP57_9CORY|nr:hypothetical protein [Candidatus Corynebacterium avicola]
MAGLTPVVLLAHGSRHPNADAAVSRIAAEVERTSGRRTMASHLDFSPLTLTEVARLLGVSGHREAVVVPLLFTDAFHLRQDVPDALSEAEEASGVHLHLAAPVGLGEDMAALIAGRVGSTDRLVLYSVGSSVPGANDTVAALAARAGELLGVPGHAVVATGGEGAGPDALVARCRDVGNVSVQPLFFSPGTLWDLAVRELSGQDGVQLGEPLGEDVAPLVVARAEDKIDDVTGERKEERE